MNIADENTIVNIVLLSIQSPTGNIFFTKIFNVFHSEKWSVI